MASQTAVSDDPALRPGEGRGLGRGRPRMPGGPCVTGPRNARGRLAGVQRPASTSGPRASSCCLCALCSWLGPGPTAEQGRLPEEPGLTAAPHLLILTPASCKVRAKAAAHLLGAPLCRGTRPCPHGHREFCAALCACPLLPTRPAQLAGSRALCAPGTEHWTFLPGQPLTLGFRVPRPTFPGVRSSCDIVRCRPGRGGPLPGDGWGPS